MPDTALSPRLHHLLIQEDRATGKLFMPFTTGSTPPPMTRPISPPVSPSRQYPLRTPPPVMYTERPGMMLPPPTVKGARPPTSIFSLLNDLTIETPPSSSSSNGSAVPRVHLSPPVDLSPSATTLPPAGFTEQQGRGYPSIVRPDILRRHSSHPYEQRHPRSPVPSTSPPQIRRPVSTSILSSYEEFPIMSVRAPISRTTRACNACRSRKVRCDAGGATNASGETTACSRCTESGVECVYTGVQKKRGPCPG
jgi:hypothetical protein